MDSLRGASGGVVGSWNAVWGVRIAVFPSSFESKLGKETHGEPGYKSWLEHITTYHLIKTNSSGVIPLTYFHL